MLAPLSKAIKTLMRISLVPNNCNSDISQSASAHTPRYAEAPFGEVVFLGSIYNQDELCVEYEFDRGGDTAQFLLAAWRKERGRLFKKLDGNFALIVMDYDSGHIWAGRDIFGFIPLFYRKGENGPEFSFEPGSLAKGSGVDSLDLEHIAEYLSGHLVSQNSSELIKQGFGRILHR